MNNSSEDTQSLTDAGLAPPRRALTAWTYVTVGAGVVLWGVAITAVTLAAYGHIPQPIISALAAAAVTSSVVAAVVGVHTAHWRAITHDHKCLRDGQKEVRAELSGIRVELARIAGKLEANDNTYWRAYSDVASDLLGQDRNR